MKFVLWTLAFVAEVSICTINVGSGLTSFKQLANALNISDANTLLALENATGAGFGSDAVSRAREACAISQVVFKGLPQTTDAVVEYLDSNSNSSLYLSRIQNEWYFLAHIPVTTRGTSH